ncbi:hypothetical protein ABZ464_44045 [Streptomyces sp. NPDC005820]|uniref:hypothetical protein n=1 Tax=Streptomyces sp. NPDC005820 TaxID=3157069 RepID=UPI0033E12C4B
MIDTLASGMRPHLYNRPIRMSDLDPFNHVRLLERIQDAHVDLFYLQPGLSGEEIRPRMVYVRHEITTVRRASFRLTSHIKRGLRTYCTCVSTAVAYDETERCPRRLEEAELAVLRRYAPEA